MDQCSSVSVKRSRNTLASAQLSIRFSNRGKESARERVSKRDTHISNGGPVFTDLLPFVKLTFLTHIEYDMRP